MKKLVFIILLSFHFSLSANEDKLPSSVIWGIFCGECAENCSTIWKIDNFGLSIDESDVYFDSSPFKYEFSGKSESKEKFDKFKWVLEVPIPSIFNNSQVIIGQPDAYDQCGYLMVYVIGEKQYQALIDPDKVPKELEGTIKRLFQ